MLALKEPLILHDQYHGCRCRLSMYGWTKFSNYLTRMRNWQNLATKWTRKRKRLICNLTHVYTSQHFKTSFTYDPETTAMLLLQNTPTSEVNLVTMQYIVMNGWFTSFSFHVNRPPHSWDKALNLKLQDQGHGCGQRARSYSQPSNILTHFFFISYQSDHQFLIQLFRNLTLKHLRSRSHVRSKVNVTYYTQYPTDALPFHFTSIRPTIPEIWPK